MQDKATDRQIAQVRSLVGLLAWIARQCRPELSYRFSGLQSEATATNARYVAEYREIFKELYTKLNDFTKHELIGKIISINSKNTKSPKIDKTNKNDENQSRTKNIDKSISKLTINIGRSNNMSPDMLIRLINKTIRVRNTKIGKISVKKNYSTFEVD